MKCPACQIDLHMTERQSIEIDYCPQCRGVWLDRGELDKIRAPALFFHSRLDGNVPLAAGRQAAEAIAGARFVELSSAERSSATLSDQQHYERRVPFEKRWDDDDDDERHRYGERRRKSFLGELFDFG